MPRHPAHLMLLALALSALLTAVAGISALGIASAMPADEASGSSSLVDVGDALPSSWTLPRAAGPISVPDAAWDVLPAPSPVTRSADEVQRWIDDVAGGVSVQQDDPWAIIDECVLADMEGDPKTDADDTPGASIAIAVDGVITYTKGYGVRHPTSGGEIDADTLFRIGSTTKMMTAAAVMQLVEDGTVDLMAPLTDYLPEYALGHPWSADDLTLDLMMSHQTGMIDQYHVNTLFMPLMDWVQATGSISLPLYAPPGSYWNYANPNFSLAGAVVERMSGVSYTQYMSQNVWDPAGMPLSTIDPTEVISSGNYTVGLHGGQEVAPGDVDYPMLAPAGTAYSTPTELVTWALLLQSGDDEVLSAASKQVMQARRKNTDAVPWEDYGYGIFVTDWRDMDDPDQRVVVYDHGGNIQGGSSQLYWIPERGLAVSILASTIRSLGSAAACAIETLAGIEPIPYDSLKTEPETWDAFTGTYSMMDVFQYPWTGTVTRVTDTLYLDFPDIYGSPMLEGRNLPMYYAFADIFVPLGNSMLLGPNSVDMTFIRDREETDRVRYMKNRNLVGQRVGQFPGSIAVEGDGCADLSVKSELDMPVLQIETSGLITPTRLVSVPLPVDDPNDPTTASTRIDVTAGPGGIDMLYARAVTQPDDAAALFLLADLNGDGDFSFDEEMIDGGYNMYGESIMYASQPLPEGEYQVWVWGLRVNGEDSELSLDLTVMQGDNLRLENHPRGLADGAEWTMRVCAENVDDLTEPASGMVQFSYDSPPRLFRVMVDWTPAGATPTIYLPYGSRGPQ